jgi:hypothetical protein
MDASGVLRSTEQKSNDVANQSRQEEISFKLHISF